MIIPMIVNGKRVSPDIPPHQRLIDVLREEFHLLKTRGECYHGVCGRCLVLVNDHLAQACLLPAFKVREQNILTIEGFEKTPAYRRIIKGFAAGGYYPCDSCLGGRILATHALLETTIHPSEQEILRQMSYSACSCSNIASLVAGVREAGRIREGR